MFKRALTLSIALFAASGAVAQTVLGKLGQSDKPTKIYASPSTRSKVFYSTKAREYVIVRDAKTKTGWIRVLMSNGIDAYAPSAGIKVLPYEVTSKDAGKPRSQLAALTSRGGATTRNPRSNPVSNQGDFVSAEAGAAVAQYGTKFVGTPYVWGGNDLQRGVDCSGFTQQLYRSVGLELPRVASDQANVGRPITRLEELRPGDRLYFFETKHNKIGHTGIYMGNGQFVHAARGEGKVAISNLGAPNWMKILYSARR